MKFLSGIFLLTLFLGSCSSLKSYYPKAEVPNKLMFNPSWVKNLDPMYDSGNLPIALQSPLIYEGIVYVGSNAGFMQAYELDNGKMVWSEKDDSTYHASPVIYKDQVVYGTVQGRVISRHYTTGKIKYSVDLGASVETKGVIHKGRILFQLRNHQVFCLDVETGKILWGYKRSVSYVTTLQRSSTPVVYKDKVLIGFADGSFAALSLEEGVLLYETKLSSASKFVDVDNAAFVLDDKVYIGSVGSPFSILDPNTGKIIKRSEFIASRAPFYDAEFTQGQLWIGTQNGEVLITDKNLVIQNKIKVSSGVITSIAKYKNGLAISSTSGEIVYVDPKSLKSQEKYNLGHSYSAVFGDIETKENYLAILSSRNRLFVFK